MVRSKEIIKVVAEYSNSRLDTWKAGVLENLETVLAVVDRIKTIKNIPAEAPLRWKVVKFQIDKLGALGCVVAEDINRIRLTLLEGFWPSSNIVQYIQNIRDNKTPRAWRYFFLNWEYKLQDWIGRFDDVVEHLEKLDTLQELHVVPLSRLPDPRTFLYSLLIETGKDAEKLTLQLEIMEEGKELDQIYQGCYAERLYLYGGRIENCELVGANSGLQLWFQVNRVKLTPMEISRAVGARVVKIPLHTRLVLDNHEEVEDDPILYIFMAADQHQSFWTLKKAKFFLEPPKI